MSASDRSLSARAARADLSRLGDLLAWVGVLGIGFLAYTLVRLWLGTSPLGLAARWLLIAWDKTGPTFLPLAALSLHLVLVAARLLVGPASRAKTLGPHLVLIETTSPALGFLGTLIGLASAMGGIDLAKGLETAVVTLTAGTGQAIYSSIYGVVQALAAYALRFAFHLDGESAP
ncbi:MAG: MotA/TolQ/ExbB proton channel family protein [Candidatus Rokubacteria bacterium]|nr:MotA/TolQ/ExbB proton channel family protein [Candidatus Rokubacteria bacterium]